MNSGAPPACKCRLFYADEFVLPLPPGHRFPMSKYAGLRTALAVSGEFPAQAFCVPEAASDTEISRAHSADYLHRVANGLLTHDEQRRIGFPWSAEMVERSRRSAGATLAACRVALEAGWAANLAGGTHHARHAEGAGFCVFNDAAIAALAMRAEGRVRRVAVVDCDVHQGDGTAAILAGNPEVFTLSMHGEKNFPFRKEVSDLDVALPDGTGDDAYLAALDGALRTLFRRFAPDLIIYLAGADPYRDDRYGRLHLSMAGLRQRDERVLGECRARGLPVTLAMAGGYAREVADTVAIHTASILAAKRILGA